MVVAYIVIHFDVGIISANSQNIGRELSINKKEIGLIASSQYFGKIVGSIGCVMFFAKLKARPLLIIASVINAISVSIFSFVDNYPAILVSRAFAGLCMVRYLDQQIYIGCVHYLHSGVD